MPIEDITPRDAIRSYLERRISELEQALARELAYIGESALRIARERGSYTDRTGNLRNSTGYVIAVNGRIVKQGGMNHDEGKDFAERLALSTNAFAVLVVVAGMNYARYVSARGYDVLNSAELHAKRLAKQLTSNQQ